MTTTASDLHNMRTRGSPLEKRAAEEIIRLRRPWRAVDGEDWLYLESVIPDGGRGRFWKAVFEEVRNSLTSQQHGEKL